MASGCPPLRVPLFSTATRGRKRVDQYRCVGNGLAVVRDDEEIDGADSVGRAHQIELFVPGQIAEVRDTEAAKGHDAADGLRILGWIRILRFETGAIGIRLATAWQRGLERLSCRTDDAPVQRRLKWCRPAWRRCGSPSDRAADTTSAENRRRRPRAARSDRDRRSGESATGDASSAMPPKWSPCQCVVMR